MISYSLSAGSFAVISYLIGKNNVTTQSFENWSYLYCKIHTLIIRILVKPS